VAFQAVVRVLLLMRVLDKIRNIKEDTNKKNNNK
jgi:hypothetical protein